MMAKQKKSDISIETEHEALRIAKKIQKEGQSKEQTRLIAQGIQKGISEYKKSIKNKFRQADKAKKKRQKAITEEVSPVLSIQTTNKTNRLAWVMLVLSWIFFVVYLVNNR